VSEVVGVFFVIFHSILTLLAFNELTTHRRRLRPRPRVRIVIWSNDAKLTVHGVVVSRRPGFGISIKFTEMTEEVRQQLQRVIQSLIVRSQ
jgi:hypothetical protein